MNKLPNSLKEYMEKELDMKAEKPCNPSTGNEKNSFQFYLLKDTFETGYELITSFCQKNGYLAEEKDVSSHSGPGYVKFAAQRKGKTYGILFEYRNYSFTVAVTE